VAEELAEAAVPALRHAGDLLDVLPLLRVVVDVEVLGLEHLEVEVPVLDLVLAEVLRGRGRRQAEYATTDPSGVRVRLPAAIYNRHALDGDFPVS
jgi:hypothetical protein